MRTHTTLADGLALFGGWLLAATGAAYLIAPSGVLPLLQRDFLVGAVGASWVLSIAYAAEAIAAIPVGVGLDRFDNRRIVAAAVLALVGANVWGGAAAAVGAYWSFLGSRFVGGVAFTLLWLGTINLVTARFADRTATAVGIHTTSGPAGLAAGIALGPVFASVFEWYAVFPFLAAASLFAFAVFWVVTRSQPPVHRQESVSVRRTLSVVLRNRTVLLVAVLSFVAYSLFLLFSSWMPTYLTEAFGLSLARSSLYVAVFPAVGIVARSAGGVVSDYVLGNRPRLVVRFSSLVLVPIVFGLAVSSAVWSVVALMVAGGFFVQSSIGLFFTYGSKVVPARAEGTAIAVITTVALTGSFTAPVVAGALVASPAGYTAVFGYAVVLSVLGLATTWPLPALQSG